MERKHFKGALDIFAQFYIEPLMKQESVDREIRSVDSGENLIVNNSKIWTR